jgi:hypothetical protein
VDFNDAIFGGYDASTNGSKVNQQSVATTSRKVRNPEVSNCPVLRRLDSGTSEPYSAACAGSSRSGGMDAAGAAARVIDAR